MDSLKIALLALGAILSGALGQAQIAGPTLTAVRERGVLLCGVDRSEAEYSSTDEHGNRAAFDRDLCKAVAVAALGPDARVLVTYYADDVTSMEALAHGKVDMIASLSVQAEPVNTAGQRLSIAFSGPVLYDAVGLMVPRSAGVATAAQLSGQKICYLTETATESKLQAWFTLHRLDLLPFPFQEEGEMEAAFVTDNCVALGGDLTRLAQTRASTGTQADEYVLLKQTFGADTLAMAYRTEDVAWASLLQTTRNLLVGAEAFGITRLNVRTSLLRDDVRQWMQRSTAQGQSLGLAEHWVSEVIAAVGNYGEMFDRDLGRDSQLKLDRGENALTLHGGDMEQQP